jgi:two-component system response regulator MtrA
MTIAWIAEKPDPNLVQALRTVHWEIKEFSPAQARQVELSQFWDVELVVLESSGNPLIDLCRDICSKKIVPVLILVPDLAYARAALEVGADDFVVFPADSLEVLLRVRKLVRAAGIVHVGHLHVDLVAWRVSFGGCHVHLSSVEFRLLACLAKRAGQIVSHAEIMEDVWNWETEYAALTQVKNAINRLRQKLEPDVRNPQYIVTISKHGYRLRNQRQWEAHAQVPEKINLPFYNEHRARLD